MIRLFTQNSDHIEIEQEVSMALELPDLTFVFITDASIVKEKEADLRNTIYLVLLIGLATSFSSVCSLWLPYSIYDPNGGRRAESLQSNLCHSSCSLSDWRCNQSYGVPDDLFNSNCR